MNNEQGGLQGKKNADATKLADVAYRPRRTPVLKVHGFGCSVPDALCQPAIQDAPAQKIALALIGTLSARSAPREQPLLPA